jgi:SSS family solute:Na+ symporter
VNAIEVTVFTLLFAAVALIGVYASRWRSGNLSVLDEWALAGRRFGSFVTWFLQGGSLYTTYAFIAVPGLVFASGAIGFFAIVYAVLIYPIAYLTLPRIWTIARDRGYVTAADFVRDRLTGIVATMPYIALQVYGMEVCIAQLGMPVEASLAIAFAILAGITYVAGLRSAALIAVAKDVLIWVTVLVAVIYIPIKLGGYAHILAQVPASKLDLHPSLFASYSTLALGSALALYLYPHALTGTFSSSSSDVIRRNSIFLPIYTVMLLLLAMLGYMAIAAHTTPTRGYGVNGAVPGLFQQMFPPAFAGFALAAIAIGALVPAAVMAIAAANLFSRNIVRELRPSTTPEAEARISKLASLTVKFGAVAFILVAPATSVVNFQLAGGVWILQTLPAVFLTLFVGWLDRRAILAGWTAGTAWGTTMLIETRFKNSTHTFSVSGHGTRLYIGLAALLLNLVIVLIGTPLARLIGIRAATPAISRR